LSGGSGKIVQATGHFLELDGTYHTFAICNADLHLYNWATDSWSVVDLSAEGVTLDASAKVDWAVSRGRLIATDGVNKPFMWSPATDTYTVLTQAPISNGIEIYYDKAFFFDLPGDNSVVFEWSNEGDPETGYAGENFDWEFVQTDGGPVTCLVGMNESMPVFKEDSIALLRGAANDEFKTDAVREGVSETEGTPGKWNVISVEGDIYYLAKLGPRTLVQGYNLVPLDLDQDGVNVLGPHWKAFSTNEIANAIVFNDRERRHVVWLTALDGETAKYEGLLYSITEGSWSRIAFDSSFDFKSAASVEDLYGAELVMLGDDDGNVWIYGEPDVTLDGDAGYNCRIRSREYGSHLGGVQKRLCQVDWVLNVTSDTLSGVTRVWLDGDNTPGAFDESERGFYMPTTGKKRYRRAYNHVGWTVGWELEVNSGDGQCELHQTLTQISTVGAHPSRG
jgi:hypothetical protein